MNTFGLMSILLVLAALFGVLNSRILRLPNAVGMMLVALLASLAVLGVDFLLPAYGMADQFRSMVEACDLNHTLLDGALSFLLFAGALQMDLPLLWDRKFPVLALAVPGTLLAILLFALPIWGVLALIGLATPLVWCVLLGAILAPTDPVSVQAILKRVGLPQTLQTVFVGESLFNDGVAVVVFAAALQLVTTDQTAIGVLDVAARFMVEAVGGSLLGLAAGWVTVRLMALVDEIALELLLSIALAAGAYSLANALHMSGPIAAVCAGLVLGTGYARRAQVPSQREDMLRFWHLMEEIFNALLFLLIGLEVVSITFHFSEVIAAAVAIPLAVLARGASVSIATAGIRAKHRNRAHALALLTWGGLRGGISVAMALGLPESAYRAPLLAICYAVVVFTLVVQGLTTERLARWLYNTPGE